MTFKFCKLLIVSQTSPVEGQKPVRTADTEFNSGVVPVVLEFWTWLTLSSTADEGFGSH